MWEPYGGGKSLQHAPHQEISNSSTGGEQSIPADRCKHGCKLGQILEERSEVGQQTGDNRKLSVKLILLLLPLHHVGHSENQACKDVGAERRRHCALQTASGISSDG